MFIRLVFEALVSPGNVPEYNREVPAPPHLCDPDKPLPPAASFKGSFITLAKWKKFAV